MKSKDWILQQIKKNSPAPTAYPEMSTLKTHAIRYDDPVMQFQTALKKAGGESVIVAKGEEVANAIAKHFPETKRIALIDSIPHTNFLHASPYNPDTLADPRDVNGTELAILKGEWGVAENGAIWVTQHIHCRPAYFLPEALAVIIKRNTIVNNMHEAEECIEQNETGYGVFMSGPSKTADIESALVIGAHGPKQLCAFIVDE